MLEDSFVFQIASVLQALTAAFVEAAGVLVGYFCICEAPSECLLYSDR